MLRITKVMRIQPFRAINVCANSYWDVWDVLTAVNSCKAALEVKPDCDLKSISNIFKFIVIVCRTTQTRQVNYPPAFRLPGERRGNNKGRNTVRVCQCLNELQTKRSCLVYIALPHGLHHLPTEGICLSTNEKIICEMIYVHVFFILQEENKGTQCE